MAREPDSSDEELVQRARRGDDAARRTLIERHLPRLQAAAERRIPAAMRGKFGASDIVQDACVSAFQDLSRFEDRGRGSFAAWVRAILARKLAQEVRRLGAERRDVRREVRLATGIDPPVRDSRRRARTPPSHAAAAEQSAAVRAIVAALSEDYRTVLHLVHFEGLTFAQAGLRMGRSADAVRMLYGRAMDKVAERMDLDPPSGA